MSKPRFEKGKLIESLDDLYEQDLIYIGDNIIHKGYFHNFNIKLCKKLIDDRSVFYALEKIYKRGK